MPQKRELLFLAGLTHQPEHHSGQTSPKWTPCFERFALIKVPHHGHKQTSLSCTNNEPRSHRRSIVSFLLWMVLFCSAATLMISSRYKHTHTHTHTLFADPSKHPLLVHVHSCRRMALHCGNEHTKKHAVVDFGAALIPTSAICFADGYKIKCEHGNTPTHTANHARMLDPEPQRRVGNGNGLISATLSTKNTVR